MDKVLGIGLNPDSPEAQDPERWEGMNILGKCLMKVRHFILNNPEFQQEISKIRQTRIDSRSRAQKAGVQRNLGQLLIDEEEPNDLSEGKMKITLQKYAKL